MLLFFIDMLSECPILDDASLRAFAAFAETRSFTKAAARVGLSQPALFERVKRLAEQLEVPLYQRFGRELILTDAGIRVAAFARDTLERSAAFVGDLKGTRTHHVTLAAGEGSYLYVLPRALARFRRAKVGELEVLTLGGKDAMDAVRSGQAHVAVGVFDLVPRGLESHDILRTPLCAAISSRHRLAKKRSVRLSDLDGERLVLAPEGRAQRDIVGRALASLGGTIEPPIEADGWALMLSFAAAGLGVAVVNGVCTPPKGAVLRPIPELGVVIYRLLYRAGTRRMPAAAHLIERILEGRSAS